MNHFEKCNGFSTPPAFFFSSEWEKLLVEAFPYISFEHYLYKGQYEVRITKIENRITTTPFSDGGDVFSLSNEDLSLRDFRKDLQEEFGVNVRLRVNEFYCPVSLKEESHSLISDFRIALSDEEALFTSFRKTLRSVLKTLLPMGVHISRTKDMEDIDAVYRVYVKNMQSAHGVVLPKNIFSILCLQEKSDLFVLRKGNTILAASLFLNTSSTSHYYISVSSDNGKALFASHRMVWKALQKYTKEGKREFFLGGTAVNSSLYTFKKGWRGEEYRVYEIGDGVTHEKARTSSLRSLWSLIPVSWLPFVTKYVGRYVF